MSASEQAPRPRTKAWVLAFAVSIFVLWALGPVSELDAQVPAALTVTVAEAGPYADGQFITVDVTVNGGEPATDMTAYICRAGKVYDSNAALRANAGDCPVVAISASMGESSQFPLPTYAGGLRARGLVTVGIGTAGWNSTEAGAPKLSLTCGPSDPCALVVKASLASGTPVFDSSTTLTFKEPDPFAGCAGGAEGAPTSAGADRMLEMWSSWTLAQCQAGTDAASTVAPTPGEGTGVAAFAAGQVDLAYAAAGYAAPGFLTSDATRRPAVATPLALNAVVLAAAGGSFPTGDPEWPEGLKRPYTEVRLTRDEVATLLGKSQFDLQVQHGPAVLERNPELGKVYNTSTNASAPLALSSTSALSLYMTTYLDTLAPDAWKANAAFGNADRGIDANLGTAAVPFGTSGVLNLLSDTSLLERSVYRFEQGFSALEPGPQWVLTDLATARELGLTPVSIQNAAGEYVRPTPESLAAAVPTMKAQEDGTLAPDVTTTAAGAYPLTVVEYALSPREKLVDPACAPRSASQTLLKDWLTFITGPGQESLAGNGFVPLPGDLAGAAQQSIAQVGSQPTTCTPTDPTVPPGDNPPTSPTTPGGTTPTTAFGAVPPADGGAGGGTGGSGAADGAGEDGVGTGEPRQPTEEDVEKAAKAADEAEIEYPPLLGARAVSAVAPPAAVLLVVLVTSAAAFGTSGRPLPESVGNAGRKAKGAAGAVAAGVGKVVPRGRGLGRKWRPSPEGGGT
jgi:ABC-type phosphate transport system substrate-binding protein